MFGYSVSLSSNGTTFVAGAPGNDDVGILGNSGHVRVYKYNSTAVSYTQVGLTINGESDRDEFGTSVSISADGTTFVAGAPYNDGGGESSGQVRVYKYNPTVSSYTQLGLDINGEAVGDYFGFSVSISADGTTFVVGAIWNDGNGITSGHVRVYKYNSSVSTYAQIGLDIDGEAAGDEFGTSVSISADGTTFVAGAPYNDGNGDKSGHVRVYKYNSTVNTYVQVGLDIDGGAVGDFFGWSVSISADGTTFVVGAPYYSESNVSDSGYVRVYKYNSTFDIYTQIGLDIDGESAGDRFGLSVSISADATTFVVGAPLNDGCSGVDSGHVRVYKFNSTVDSYTQLGADIDGEAESDNFGSSVSISADGTKFAVGAIRNDGNGFVSSGHVRVYTFTGVAQAPCIPPVPTMSPTATPNASPEKCGLLGWNLFCPRRGKCGLIKRLLNLGNCD